MVHISQVSNQFSCIVYSSINFIFIPTERVVALVTSHSSTGIQAHACLWAMFNKLETSLQYLIQPIRLLQVLNVEQSSTSLQIIYCNLSTQPCCYEFHCKYDTDSVLYHFLLGCTLTDLTPTDAVGLCADRGFANTLSITNGVVCFSRTAARSEAVYICDDGFHQDGIATRVCQSDGV